MAIASTVEAYLQANHFPYDVMAHNRTGSSTETAHSLHLPAERLAKAVVLGDRGGYVVAVLPSNRRVDVQALSRALDRDLTLVPEYQMSVLFEDCALGAIPALGFAYGIPTVFDECLFEQPEIYFEAGDHEAIVRLDAECFREVLRRADRAEFCESSTARRRS